MPGTLLPVLLSGLFVWWACETMGPDDAPNPCENSDQPRQPLYVAYEDHPNHGVLLIDLDSLLVIDSLIFSEVPQCLTISPDSSLLYVLMDEIAYIVRLCDFSVIDSISLSYRPAVSAITSDGHYLIGGSYGTFFVIDTRSQTTIFSTDTLVVFTIIADPTEPVIYGAGSHVDSTCDGMGIFRFDLRTMNFDLIYARENVFECHDINPTDIGITADGEQLLFDSYQTNCYPLMDSSAEWPRGNVLHHIDSETGEVVAMTCLNAYYVNLALTADDQYAYITDFTPSPAPCYPDWTPSGILRRYHLPTRTVEDFFDFSQTLTGSYHDLKDIALLPDGNTAVISTHYRYIRIVDLAARTLLGTVHIGPKRITAISPGPRFPK